MVVAVAPPTLRHTWPLVFLLDFLSKEYCLGTLKFVLIIRVCHVLINQVPHCSLFCVALKMFPNLIITVPQISADHLVHCLIFHCNLSVLTFDLFFRIPAMHYVSKIFPFADFGQNFQRLLGNNLVSHWCSHPFYCPWYNEAFFCFP